MKLTYAIGDLVQASETMLVHGCNAQGVMGSGVAKQLKERYPTAVEPYFANKHKLSLGAVYYGPISGPSLRYIANCITQQNYGKDGQKYISYDAIDACFKDVRRKCYEGDIKDIAMPRIGAGLGGGSWHIIEAIINDIFEKHFIQPIVYDL